MHWGQQFLNIGTSNGLTYKMSPKSRIQDFWGNEILEIYDCFSVIGCCCMWSFLTLLDFSQSMSQSFAPYPIQQQPHICLWERGGRERWGIPKTFYIKSEHSKSFFLLNRILWNLINSDNTGNIHNQYFCKYSCKHCKNCKKSSIWGMHSVLYQNWRQSKWP